LVSAGIAMVRTAGSHGGGASVDAVGDRLGDDFGDESSMRIPALIWISGPFEYAVSSTKTT
jgi:hypothetical protein